MNRLHVDGTANLLAAAQGAIGRWVQLSSVGVYGPRTDGLVTEDDAPNPAGVYETTKAASDHLVQEAWNAGRLSSLTILRPSIVFGPGMRTHSLRQLVRMIKRRAFFFIGPPGASANYVHVDAVVGALLRCGTDANAHGRVYNISDWCTIEEFVAAIADSLGRRPPRLRVSERLARLAVRTVGHVPGMPLTAPRVDALVGRARYSSQRILDELGYEPEVSVLTGIRSFVHAEAWQ
jgi:nucleoside-diphosphate-sugar epimerase